MSHVKISAFMTTDVVAVAPQTPFHEIARLLAERHVSAVPVVDGEHRVVGVVSEADLLHKVEFADGTDGPGIFGRRAHRLGRHKAEGRVAADLMTAPAIAVTADVSVVKAARQLDAAGVKRRPVVDLDGHLVGIVSRADLLKVFLRTDDAIREDIVDDLFKRLWIGPSELTVEVREGVVRLEGEVEQRSLIEILTRLVRAIDGVVDVESRLTYRVDDTVSAEARYYRPLV